jgi:hypothetical protein
MKLLFLDIDGVMTNDEQVINPNHLYSFSPSCVEVLNQILRTHNIKIILTSSWRTVFDAEKLNQIFTENGVIQTPAGQTPSISNLKRGLEIKKYLEKRNPTHFVILDDMLISGFPKNFIPINPATGLTKEHIPMINQILGFGS